ncbi:MAG: caspase family protein [Hyphomicrobiales bacterium]
MKPHHPQAMAAARTCLAAILIFFAGLATVDADAAGRRVAFVVGNSGYQHLSDIVQAKTDANLMAEALKSSGYEVFTAMDIQRLAFDEKFHEFERALEGADVALFYYSGHSVQIAGQDRIVPVDALVKKAADLEPQTINLADLLQQMQLRSRIQIIIIESCRDDPFPKIAYYIGSDSQPLSTTPGCAKKSPAAGVLIAQANEPGNPLTGGSPFTETFVARAFLPNKDIHEALRQVRLDIIDQTEGGQVPYFISALEDSVFYLNDGEASGETSTPDSAGEAAAAGGAESQETAAPAKPSSKKPISKKKTAAKKPAVAKPDSVKKSSPSPKPLKAARPDARTYSYKIWPDGSLRSSLRTRQNTKFGMLSCMAFVNSKRQLGEAARMCRWE